MVFACEGKVSGVTAVQECTELFRTERRQARDLLLKMAGAFGDRDAGRGRALIAAVAEATGPYFRYEEAMYPQLTGIFGDAYAASCWPIRTARSATPASCSGWPDTMNSPRSRPDEGRSLSGRSCRMSATPTG